MNDWLAVRVVWIVTWVMAAMTQSRFHALARQFRWALVLKRFLRYKQRNASKCNCQWKIWPEWFWKSTGSQVKQMGVARSREIHDLANEVHEQGFANWRREDDENHEHVLGRLSTKVHILSSALIIIYDQAVHWRFRTSTRAWEENSWEFGTENGKYPVADEGDVQTVWLVE